VPFAGQAGYGEIYDESNIKERITIQRIESLDDKCKNIFNYEFTKNQARVSKKGLYILEGFTILHTQKESSSESETSNITIDVSRYIGIQKLICLPLAGFKTKNYIKFRWN
jgi:hypothetical protein